MYHRLNALFWFGLGAALSLAALAGCVDSYMPDVVDASANLLVVDGFINGNGVTRIKLSRTINISATTAPPVEAGAKLFFVDNTGTRYNLTEKTSGTYSSDSLQLVQGQKYQLHITLASGTAYESALVPLKVTPAIDAFSWKLDGSDVRFSLSTHDAQQQSRYYRWNFIETWEFNPPYQSDIEYDPVLKTIEGRTTPIYTCWRTERPSAIKQASTIQLSQDALTDVEVLSLSKKAERFKIRYSLLVSQYAETAEEFAYYELLRKNTEALGTVNDPLPSQLTGNVHRTDGTAEPVLGFVSAHTVQQRRLFVGRQDLPFMQNWEFDSPYTACTIGREHLRGQPDSVFLFHYPHTIVYSNPNSVPITLLIYPSANDPTKTPIIQGYLGSSAFCVDCRTRGTNIKPSFW